MPVSVWGGMSAPEPFASILAGSEYVWLRGNSGNTGCPILLVEGVGLDVIQAIFSGRT
jgi:hypothetical protein